MPELSLVQEAQSPRRLLYNLLPTNPKKYYFLAVDESTSNKHLHLYMHKDTQLSNSHACAKAHT